MATNPQILFPARLFMALGLCAPAAAAQTFVVDDDGGADVDFTSIVAAIQNVPDGSTVLVRSGIYAGFDLFRPLVVAAAPGARVEVAGQVSVRVIPDGAFAVLSGLDIASTLIGGALSIFDCDGTVFVEDCDVRTTGAVLLPLYAAHVSNCEDVVLSRTTLRGAAGGVNSSEGGEALLVTSSTAHLFECDLEGGTGTFGVPAGGAGGPGLRAVSSFVASADSRVRGGTGGVPGNPFGCFGSTGGTGGPGLELAALFGQPDPEAVLIGGSVTGGAGGLGTGGDCGDGAPGPAVQPGPFAPLLVASPAHGLRVRDPIARGRRAELVFTGLPGEMAAYVVGFEPAPAYLPGLQGTLVIDPTLAIPVVAGPLEPDGTLTTEIGPFPPGVAFVQAFFLGQAVRLSTPAAVVTPDRVAPSARRIGAPAPR